jgi:hypothetical protein
MSVAYGSREPLEGWSSPRLDQLVPAPLVRWDTVLRGRLDAVTLLSPMSVEAVRTEVELFVEVGDDIARIELVSATRSQTVLLVLP